MCPPYKAPAGYQWEVVTNATGSPVGWKLTKR